MSPATRKIPAGGVKATTQAKQGKTKAPAQIRREHTALKKALTQLTEANLLFLSVIDESIAKDRSVPEPVGRRLAQLCNGLEFLNDQIRHAHLNVDVRNEDKSALVRRLRAAHRAAAPR